MASLFNVRSARPHQMDTSPVSITDVFTIGIGPSSSHTVGPMRAAAQFAGELERRALHFDKVTVELFGSLALTGKGHATDIAVMLGLVGWLPETVDPEQVSAIIGRIREEKVLALASRTVGFDEGRDVLFHKGEFLPRHPNGMRFTACAGNEVALQRTFYSVGGGSIVGEEESEADRVHVTLRFPFDSAKALIDLGEREQLNLAQLMQANETAWRAPAETLAFVDRVREAMMDSIERGCRHEGVLPGGLKVRRRASALYKQLNGNVPRHEEALDWVSLYALAVNEENAAGGRIVTAPTNGAAGILPAVLKYFEIFCADATLEKSREFLLTVGPAL